jgi:hypothetical protein
MRLSKIKRNAIDYGGKIMSNFFDETMQGLLEAAEIAKGNITLTEWENMPAPTFYVVDNDITALGYEVQLVKKAESKS